MLKNYTPPEYKTQVEYELVFDDGHNNGYGFPCDKEGQLLETEEQNPVAHENYRYCLAHPEEFERFNKVIARRYRVRENANGTCICGAEAELYNQYLGACECPKCGQWYNMFGQELLKPEFWEEEA